MGRNIWILSIEKGILSETGYFGAVAMTGKLTHRLVNGMFCRKRILQFTNSKTFFSVWYNKKFPQT